MRWRRRRAEAAAPPELPERLPTWRRRGPAPEPPHVAAYDPESWTLVLAVAGTGALAGTVTSLLTQTDPRWELLVVPVGEGGPASSPLLSPDERLRLLDPAPSLAEAYDAGLAAATGRRVAFVVEGDVWHPDRLAGLHSALAGSGATWAYDAASRPDGDGAAWADRELTPEALAAGRWVDLGVLVVDRDAAVSAGGVDGGLPEVPAAVLGHDLARRLLASGPGLLVPRLGVDTGGRPSAADLPRSPWLDHEGAWHDVVTARHLAGTRGAWPSLAERELRAGVTAVVVANGPDAPTDVLLALAGEHGGDVDVVLVDTRRAGAPWTDVPSAVTVVTGPPDAGPALALAVVPGLVEREVVVQLDATSCPRPGWAAALAGVLVDPAVLAAGSVVVREDGGLESAGTAFPRGGGLPTPFLAGRPEPESALVVDADFSALAGPGVAFRAADLAEVGGPDALLGGHLAAVDLGLRLADLRPGRHVVVPTAVLDRTGPVPDGRPWADRRVLLERWRDRLPGDDHRLWALLDRRVLGHRVVEPLRGPRDRRLWPTEAVLEPRAGWRPVGDVVEGRPPLRWAIKNAAPAGEAGEQWGDTHFARQLADALRRLGQEVRVDHRPDFHRDDAWRDDVVLVLRGRRAHPPACDQVNLLWMISHPDWLGEWEWLGYDVVYAASATWPETLTARTGTRCVPLLQCTDPEVFHPGLAEPDTGERLLFVGNSRNAYRPMVHWALEHDLPLGVYGSAWDGVVPDDRLRATYLPNDRVGAAYRSAGLVLNDHWDDMRAHGFLSNRLFDAVASGARVVTDDVAGLRDVFGPAVQVARSAAELAALAGLAGEDRDRVFGDDAARRAQAAEVHRLHSFDARAGRLLDDAWQVIRRRDLREGR